MKRVWVCAALLFVLVPAGCGGSGDGKSGGAISFQLFGEPDEVKVYRQLVAAYEKQSGRQVELIEVADRRAHVQKLTSAFGAGAPPDAFLLNYRNFGGFAQRGVLDPAGPRLKKSATLKRRDFYPQALDAFKLAGDLQCMPQNVSSPVVYYNRDAIHDAGLPDPARRWTYDDLVEMARELKRTAPERDPLGFEPEIIRLAPFVWSAGGELVDRTTAPSGFTLDTPEARRGLLAFFRLARFGPTEAEAEARPFEERFINGELAMLISSRRDVPMFRTIDGFDWDVAPLPEIEGERVSVLHSDAYCLAKGGGADAAWDFVEFATGPAGQRILAKGGRTVPSLRAVARSEAFLDPAARPASSRVFLDAIPRLRRLPNSANWALVEDAANMVAEEAFFEAAIVPGPELRELVEEFARRLNQETASRF